MHVLPFCIAAICQSKPAGHKDYWPVQKPVRDVSRKRRGCGGRRVYSFAYPAQRTTGSMGSGQVVRKGGRTVLSARAQSALADPAGGCHPCCRCSSGDGGWVALQGPCSGDRRGLGGSACAWFHRDKAAGAAIRGKWNSLLADPARHKPRSECGTGPLAGGVDAFGPASPRSGSTRRSAVAGGPVPLSPFATGNMGRPL